MKATKRILSLLLALALGLALIAPALCVPAFADNDPAYAPIITKQPKNPLIPLAKSTIQLDVSANLPDGVDGILSYAWYNCDWQPGVTAEPIGADAKLSFYTDTGSKNKLNSSFTLCVVVTNTYTDENGDAQTASAKSELITFTTMFRLRDIYWYVIRTPFYSVRNFFISLPLLFLLIVPLAILTLVYPFIYAMTMLIPLLQKFDLI